MTRALTRTNLHSSRLIRTLVDLAILDAGEPRIDFAEKLGFWVDYSDAINLSSALNAGTVSLSSTGASSGVKSFANVAVSEEFNRIRAGLVNSIKMKGSPNVGRTKIELPSPALAVTLDFATAYGPYRQYYCAHQRDMDSSVRPLRAKVRQALSGASPALKQLAALDEALERVLHGRENKLLATIPVLLGQRFEQLRKAHQQKLVDTQQADNPDDWMKSGAWLARFCHELQAVLLAELDVRLQPTLGLMEAFNHEITKHK